MDDTATIEQAIREGEQRLSGLNDRLAKWSRNPQEWGSGKNGTGAARNHRKLTAEIADEEQGLRVLRGVLEARA